MSYFWLDETTRKRYNEGRAFTYNGVQYTTAGANAQTFYELGFVRVEIEPRPDDRYYIVSGPNDDGSYTYSPRDLDDLKAAFIEEQKQTARSILSNTDWYIIRALELTALGVPTVIPAATGTFRGEVRAASDAREALIDGCATIEELEALMKGTDLPEFPSEEE